MNTKTIFFLVVLCLIGANNAFSQDASPEQTLLSEEVVLDTGLNEGGMDGVSGEVDLDAAPEELQSAFNNEEEEYINYDGFQSVLFTYWELQALQKAGSSQGYKRDGDATRSIRRKNNTGEEKVKPPPEERYIRLGGISYKGKDNWTVWLNQKKITPKNVPPEILDINVFDDYVEIKWFDEYSNKIFPIRLRARQRFNIDTLTFLPG